MMNRNFLLSLILLIVSFSVLSHKGYLSVRYFNVEERDDIKSYLDKVYLNRLSFFYFSKSKIEDNLISEFSDVKSLKIQRTPLMGLDISLEERDTFAKVDYDDFYISEEGVLFKDTNLDISLEKPLYNYSNEDLLQKVLKRDSIEFIKGIDFFPELQIKNVIGSSFLIVPIEDNMPTIKIERDVDNLNSMTDPTNRVLNDLKNRGVKAHYLIILNDKIVVKETME